MIKNAVIKIALAAAAASFVVAAPAAARTPLEKYLKTRGFKLPNVIRYDDLHETAYDDGIFDLEKMLADHNAPIVGAGDSRYVRTADLLRVCGKKCSYHSGWGIFLSKFAVIEHRR